MSIRRLPIVALVLIASIVPGSWAAQERGPSTPEERKRAVEIATLLENDPFNKKRTKPKVKITGLEELLAKQQSGQLGGFVKTTLANCTAKQ